MGEPVATGVDPDVDLHVPAQRDELRSGPWPVLAAISAGGVVGALARHALTAAFPHPPGGFPWAVFMVNVSGCLLIGALMVLINRVWAGRRLLRPFLGVGVLGGYTTFSTYAVDIQQAVAAGAAAVGLVYLVTTVVGALLAVWVGSAAATWAVHRRDAHPAGGRGAR
jgi:CrcB protein